MDPILTIMDFERAFPDEEACQEYLAQIKWRDGFECPRCLGETFMYISKRKLFECKECHHQTSIIVGTIFENTKKPLRLWFWAIFLLTTTKKAMSIMELSRKLGLNYDTAWTWHHKIMVALESHDVNDLKGVIEVDETFYGPNTGAPGRSKDKSMAIAAVEVIQKKDGKSVPGLLRIEQIAHADGETIMRFLEDGVEVDTQIRTDGWSGYKILDDTYYRWEPEVLGSPEAASDVHPWVHVVFRNLKMVLNATHAGVSPTRLKHYLKGFEFRFNHRGFVGSIFYSAVRASIRSEPITWRKLWAEGSG